MDLLRAGVGAGALLAGIGVFCNYVILVPVEQQAAQQRIVRAERLVLISPKTGTRLVLSGDGLDLLDKAGHPLVKLAQFEGNPELMLTQWTAGDGLVSAPPLSLRGKRSRPFKLKEGGSLDLHPTLVYMTRCASFACGDNASLGLEGGTTLLLNSGDNSEGISNSGIWESNRCLDAKSTCYATRISLDESLGLLMTTCKTERGAPLSKINGARGCESVHIASTPFGVVRKGARVVLREDGKTRLAIDTRLSAITAFDRRGAVTWRIPSR